jgi:hypothetical protein
MSEKLPYQESTPEEIEIRRDALLLRISELREAVKVTKLNQDIVSQELEGISNQIQMVRGLADMKVAEEVVDFYERMVDSKK